MAGSRAGRARSAKEFQCGNVRGRPQVQNLRSRISGGCQAAPVMNASFLPAMHLGDWPVVANLSSVDSSLSLARDVQSTCSLLDTFDFGALVNSPDQCNSILDKLERGNSEEKHSLLLKLHKIVRQLALSKAGCRIVQKAFEVAGGSDRDLIISELQHHVVELYESPHGNHVLSRAIEVLPAAKNGFVMAALLGRGVAVSRHRYGCRVVCRLIEHCGEEQIGQLLDEVLPELDMLARHAFGNFVVQTALEHASPARRTAMLWKLLPTFAAMSTHRSGSLVAQRVLDYCEEACQIAAIHALLEGVGDNSVVEVACSHYGSYVIEQLAGKQLAVLGELKHTLACNLHRLYSSEHAQRVLIAFGLASAE